MPGGTSDNTVERIRETAAVIFGIDPLKLDVQAPLRTYGYGLYQIDLEEILEAVEQDFDVNIDEEDWFDSSTPNWEDCTVLSIAEIVSRKQKSPSPKRISRTASHGPYGAAAAAPARTAFFHRTGQENLKAGNLVAAMEALEIALSLYDGSADSRTVNLFELVRDLADVYARIGLFVHGQPSAHREQIYHRILQLCETASNHPDAYVVETLAALGEIERGANRLERAAMLLDRALAGSKQLFGAGSLQVEPHLWNRGRLAIELGDFITGDRCFGESLSILKAVYGETHSAVAKALDEQSSVCSRAGEYDRAEHLLRSSLDIYALAAPASRELALSAQRLARLLFLRNDYKGAQSLLLKAVTLMDRLLVAPARRQALTSSTEEFRADPYAAFLKDSAAIRREAASKDAAILEMLSDLALSYHETGPPLMTMETYEQVLSLFEEFYGPDDLATGRLLINAGSFYSEFGDYDKGRSLLQRALSILERTLGPDHAELAPVLHNLASCYRGIGGLVAEAGALLERCVQIRERVHGPLHERLAMPLRQLAYIYASLNRLDLALARLERASDIEQTHFVRVLELGSEEQKALWSGSIEGRSNATLAFHAQFAAADARAVRIALTASLSARGQVLDAIADSLVRLRRRGGPHSLALLDHWTSLLREESDWYAVKQSQLRPGGMKLSRDADFDRIRLAREEAEREIARSIAEVRLPSARVTLGQVQAAIPADAVLIEFNAFTPLDFEKFGEILKEPAAPRYAAFVLRSSGDPVWAPLGYAASIDAKIHALRDAWMSSHAVWRRTARELDELLLEPLRPALNGAKHVLFAPAGELCRVPFGALVDRSGHYEVERYTFTCLTSGRDLLRRKTTRTDRFPSLILASPDFEQIGAPDEMAVTQRRIRGSPWFTPLQAAKKEGIALQKLIPSSILMTGPQASKSAIMRARGPSILHIATHGFFRPAARDDSRRVADEFFGAALPSPLLRSGIALAGANRYENGLLTALEVAGLDLRGTELVSLSACETGLGDVSAWEGVYGFRRSFFLAGAESLLVSLFPVHDDATRRLMEGFYQRLISGKGRAQALREAQLSMLGSGDEFDWAGFLMIGDWRPMGSTVA